MADDSRTTEIEQGMTLQELKHVIFELVRNDNNFDRYDWHKILDNCLRAGYDKRLIRQMLKLEHDMYIDDYGVLKPIIKC